MATVLVVDDEADILELIRVNLELDGHRVLTALGGEEALDRVDEEHPDLILLDVMMPGVDGWTVLGKIKNETDLDVSSIPVLMVTARHAPEARADSHQVREARQKAGTLSPKQRELLQVLQESRSVSEAAARLDVSRSNVYASLRRIGRKLGTRSVPELLTLVRAGDLSV